MNGTVELPPREETVDVTISAEFDNVTGVTNATREAAPDLAISVDQAPGEPANVSVTANDQPVAIAAVTLNLTEENVTYAGTGAYVTDANGTLELPAPNETVEVHLSVSDAGAEAATTVTLGAAPEIDRDQPYGQQLQQLTATLDAVRQQRQQIAAWVVANNPGNRRAIRVRPRRRTRRTRLLRTTPSLGRLPTRVVRRTTLARRTRQGTRTTTIDATLPFFAWASGAVDACILDSGSASPLRQEWELLARSARLGRIDQGL